MNGASAALQSRDNVLCRRLQQSDNVGDKLVLALDGNECLERVCTEAAFLNVCSLEGNDLLLLVQGLDQLGRHITSVAEHNGAGALESGSDRCYINTLSLECLDEELVLYHHKLDVLLEALATKCACLSSIETLDIGYIEMSIF